MVWIYYPHLNRMIYSMAQVSILSFLDVLLLWMIIFIRLKVSTGYFDAIFLMMQQKCEEKKGYVIMHVIKCSVILIKPSSLSIILFCETELKYIRDNQLLWMFFMTQ